ncbi:hypothetical protein HFP72_22545 [Nocardiopsis sp. ARC36]
MVLARELLDLSGWWNVAALAAFGVLAALNPLFGRLARGGPPRERSRWRRRSPGPGPP